MLFVVMGLPNCEGLSTGIYAVDHSGSTATIVSTVLYLDAVLRTYLMEFKSMLAILIPMRDLLEFYLHTFLCTSILWWTNFNPTWSSSLFLGMSALCSVIHLCGTHSVPLRERHKKKKAARSKPKPPYVFRRRKLPYQLVLRCYARKGNRPKRMFGPSRRELLLVRREKRRRYRRKRTVRNMRHFYEALISMPSTGSFYLDRPDISLIEATIKKLGPGGVPLLLTEEFSLTSPDDIDQDTLSQRALFVGRQYHTVDVGTVHSTPLVFDTGASGGLTPFRSDFVTYEKVQFDVKGVAGNGSVIGKGIVLRRFTTRCNCVVYLPAHAFHMPAAEIRLESPQSLFTKLGGQSHALVEGKAIEWVLPDGRIIDIPIDARTNLPLLTDFVCSDEEKLQFNFNGLNALAEIEEIQPSAADEDGIGPIDYERACAIKCFSSVADATNQNLTSAQKELLFWHQKLCLNMQDLQQLMKAQLIRDQNGNLVTIRPPVIPTVYKSTANLKAADYPMNLASKLAAAKTRSPAVSTSKPVKAKEGILSQDKYVPGDLISSDQYVVKTPGRLEKGYGREALHN